MEGRKKTTEGAGPALQESSTDIRFNEAKPLQPGQRGENSPTLEELSLIALILVKSTRKSSLVSSLERAPRTSPTLGH